MESMDVDHSDNEDLDFSPFSPMQFAPDLVHDLNSDSDAEDTSTKPPPIQIANTSQLRKQLTPDVVTKIEAVLTYMNTLGLNLPIFLDLLSWGTPACITNSKINYERMALMVSQELPSILERWYEPPHLPGSTGPHAKGARHVLSRFAFDCVAKEIDKELEGVKEAMRCPADEWTTEGLTSLHINDLLLKLSSPGFGGTPKFWSLLQRLTHGRRQNRNTKKNPDLVSLSNMVILTHT